LAFIPGNLYKDEAGNFYIQGDEKVLYPDVTQPLVSQPDFSGEVHAVLESWPWQYGYPYFTTSAAVLIVPRLIFGNGFTDQVQLNLFLLRQFINVLPMGLTIILGIYLVTRFRSLPGSVGMFIFLALIPGSVEYNHRFWHADALVLFLIMLTIYFVQKDNLRFGRHFFLAAVCCGLAAATKMWGLFFGVAIAGYLLAGLLQKRLNIKQMLLYGSLFTLAMLGAILLSSPSLMAPYIARVALRGWLPMQGFLLSGYAGDASGYYDTTLVNWLKYFGNDFMKGYFFFFSFFALLVGSLWGSRVTLSRILLAWCAPTALFLIYFVALKNFQYMLPLAVPLYCGALLLPAVLDESPAPQRLPFLAKPLTKKILRGMIYALFASQFIINLVLLYQYIVTKEL
jgi:hypothetical protein